MKHRIEDQIEDHDLLIRIDQKVATLTKDICDIKNNHLVHLNARLEKLDVRLDKLEQKIAYYIGGVSVIVVLVDILLRIIMK